MNRSRSGVAGLAVAAMTTVLMIGGCTVKQAICRGGEYPVKAVGNTTGRTCVPDGQEPPDGYVRYPAGKVPKHVDDKWDKYWRTVTVDRNGDIVG